MTSSTPQPGPPVDAAPRRLGAGLLLRGTGWQASAQFVPLIINLVLTPYTIHGLGLQIYGIFLLVNSIQLVMSTFNGGIGPSVTRYMALYAGAGDKVAATRLVTTMSLIVTAVVLVIFGGFFAMIPKFFEWFPMLEIDRGGAVFLLATQVILAGVTQIRSVFQSVLFAAGRFAVTSTALLIGHAFYTIGIIITVETGAGLTGIAWIFIAQQAMGTLIMIPASLRHLTASGIGFISRGLMAEFFGYAWKIQLAAWVDTLSQEVDTIIVGRARPEQLGLFGPGATFAQQLRLVLMNAIGPITTYVGRTVGERTPEGARENAEKLQTMWVRGIVGYFAVGMPAAYFGVTAWLNLGSDIPGIVAAVLLLGHASAMIVRVLLVWCQMLKQPGLDVAQSLVFLVLKVIGTVALVVPFGVIGVAIATSFASFMAALSLSWLSRRRLSVPIALPWRDVPWVLAIACGLLALACTYGVNMLIGTLVPHGVLGLLACAIAAAPAMLLYLERAIGIRTLINAVKSR